MAKLENYRGSLEISAGLKPMGDFPVAEAHDILVDEDGKRLDEKLESVIPITRKINNKSLSEDINLSASDVGAISAEIETKNYKINSDGYIELLKQATGSLIIGLLKLEHLQTSSKECFSFNLFCHINDYFEPIVVAGDIKVKTVIGTASKILLYFYYKEQLITPTNYPNHSVIMRIL